ncbi:MAG: DUF896 domain-containing protein [Lachnospiraceae bacterium]|nr:DUF896 domain-containing protein [Lachnospiraceae bacterium]
MDDGVLDRINWLYNKEKTEGLTEEEKVEQSELREIYLATFRRNLKNQLDNIDIENPDGTVENLGEKHAIEVKEAFDPENNDETFSDDDT